MYYFYMYMCVSTHSSSIKDIYAHTFTCVLYTHSNLIQVYVLLICYKSISMR